MNRLTTVVASLAFACLTSTFAFAGPTPPKNTMSPAAAQRGEASTSASVETTTPSTSNRETPTFSTNYNAGDLNHDGLVNIDDLLLVINAWGDYAKDKPSKFDIAPAGGDSRVNLDDMLVVLINWGA